MSTRSVTFIHKKGVSKPDGDYVCKLYRHCDGYVEWGLWDELVEAFKKKQGENKFLSDYDIFQAIASIGGYEFTQWVHSDAEYVYHIYDADDNGRITITYQNGFDEESILTEEEKELYDSEEDYKGDLRDKIVKDLDNTEAGGPSSEYNRQVCDDIQKVCNKHKLWLTLYFVDEGDTYRTLLIKGKQILDEDFTWGGIYELADKLLEASGVLD